MQQEIWPIQEPPLRDIFADPIIRALMASDRVLPEEIETLLRRVCAERGELRQVA
jgi:hypothetical protein